jgi:3-oxoacyl-[acyl-carrier protein] reductase
LISTARHKEESIPPSEHRVAIVTGAARGIGKAIALRLARDGVIPVVNYLSSQERADETVAELRATAPAALAIGADVRQPDEVARMVDQVMGELGRIDMLINNAGIARDAFLHKLADEQWRAVIDTNLNGAYNTVRRVIPHMRAARSGRIVNIASVIAFSGNMGQTSYAASKAGLIGLTRSLALENAALGIRVNAVAPGFIRTAMLESIPAGIQESTLQRIPVGRFGRVDEIADVVAFLVGPAADYITGQVIHVNGGLYL